MSYITHAARAPITWIFLVYISIEVLFYHESGNTIILGWMWSGILYLGNWISSLSEGAGAFLGAFVGLLALLLGALYNAKLTRERDERLHEVQIKSIASAFMGEISSLYNIAMIRNYLEYLENFANGKEKLGGSGMPRVMIKQSYTTIYTANASNIGLLPPPLPHQIAHTYTYLKSFLEDMESMSCGSLDDEDVDFQVNFIRNAHVFLENLLVSAKSDLLPMLSAVCGGRYQLIDDIMIEDTSGQNHAIQPDDATDHG